MLGGLERAFHDLQANPQMFVIRFMLLVIAITFHEFGHAVVAHSCGDPTPSQQGRVTLNPFAHLDPIGTIGMLLYTFGWGKPVMVSPGYFRGRWDHVKVAAAGPFMNLLQALVFGIALRAAMQNHVDAGGPLYDILFYGMAVNVGLMAFNLIPIGPLDGATILKGFLPLRTAYEFEQFNRQWGMLLMIVLLFSGYVGVFIAPVQNFFFAIFLGRGVA